MKGKRRKSKRTIFESIRKPTAPPSKRIGKKRVEEKLHPSLRKTKHKRGKLDEEN